MGSKVRSLLGALAPIAASFIPGIGPLAGAAIGAGGGLLSGGGLRGALSGALSGGALTGGSSILGKALGLEGAAANGVGAGLLGAGAGGASGGLKGALLGGAAGGIGGYANAGGFDGLGDALGLTGENSLFGTAAGTPLSGGVGPTQGSGILGSATRGLSDIGSALNTGTGGGGSSYGNGISSILGGISSTDANNDAEKQLLKAQQEALSKYQPYVDAKFNPGDLTQDPGYQFRLQQGEQAIGRQQAAKGSYFSGGALKAAQDYGQGLADSTYNDAYNRWLQQNHQNIGVAGDTATLDLLGGSARANTRINNANVLNRSLSSLLGGYGAYNSYNRPYA